MPRYFPRPAQGGYGGNDPAGDDPHGYGPYVNTDPGPFGPLSDLSAEMLDAVRSADRIRGDYQYDFPRPAPTPYRPGETFDQFIQRHGVQLATVQIGDPSAPTINSPLPDGWQWVTMTEADDSYAAIVYAGPEATQYGPSIVTTLAKFTNYVDYVEVVKALLGEARNMPGQNFIAAAPTALCGYFGYHQLGTWIGVGPEENALCARSVVVVPTTSGDVYLLEFTGNGSLAQGDILSAAYNIIAKQTTITMASGVEAIQNFVAAGRPPWTSELQTSRDLTFGFPVPPRTIAGYTMLHGIQVRPPLHKGDPGAPTIEGPLLFGWEAVAPATAPKYAYNEIAYTAAGAGEASAAASIATGLFHLVGVVDPKKIIDSAPGELEVWPGFKLIEASPYILQGYPGSLTTGTWDNNGQTQFVASTTVVIPASDGAYLLQFELDCLESQRPSTYDDFHRVATETKIAVSPARPTRENLPASTPTTWSGLWHSRGDTLAASLTLDSIDPLSGHFDVHGFATATWTQTWRNPDSSLVVRAQVTAGDAQSNYWNVTINPQRLTAYDSASGSTVSLTPVRT
jgi:hypothetical protein